jgi:hypothetical protein
VYGTAILIFWYRNSLFFLKRIILIFWYSGILVSAAVLSTALERQHSDKHLRLPQRNKQANKNMLWLKLEY